ncbi:MAG: response regulator [Bacteroidales bacterium]|nr:response regulator [Bacteroidales bacterium]
MEGTIMKTNASILVIDDENVVCESFTRILTNEGYKVDTKTKPREGLKLALSRKYDLVFLDLKMDEMDGIDLLTHLREKDPVLPVVIVTGNPSMETAIESIRLQAADYILKPFTPLEILKSINKVISAKLQSDKKILSPSIEQSSLQKWITEGRPVKFYDIAWLKQDKDGKFRAGCQIPFFISNRIDEIILPTVNDTVFRGLPFATAILNDGSKIMLPSPATGRIEEINNELTLDTSVFVRNSFEKCWIAQIDPFNIDVDLESTQTRDIIILSKSADYLNRNIKYKKAYIPRLINLGCAIDCVYTVEEAIEAMEKNPKSIILIDAIGLADNGPAYVHRINQEVPDAKILVHDMPESKFEETYRKNKISYYCIDSLFEIEISDILYSVFSSVQASDVIDYYQSGIITKSISRIRITNKNGTKVSLLVFGDLLYTDHGIGHLLLNKLREKSFPIEVLRSINLSGPDDNTGEKIIDKEKEKSEHIIILQDKDSDRIPGQILKEMYNCTNSKGSYVQMTNLVIQPNVIDDNEQMSFNGMTTRAVAELIFEEMIFGI